MTWNPEAYQALLDHQYEEVVKIYEQLVDTEPDELEYYWYLGLAYLLQGQEEEAQTTWLFILSQASEEDREEWTRDLLNILDQEGQRQQEAGNSQLSWLIRGHISEIDPGWVNNLLHLLELEIDLNRFSPAFFEDTQIIELLEQMPADALDESLFINVLAKALHFPCLELLDLAKAALPHISNSGLFIKTIMPIAREIGYDHSQPDFAISLAQLCLQLQPDNLFLLGELYWFAANAKRFPIALKVAEQFDHYAVKLPLKVFARYQILYMSINSGAWLGLDSLITEYKELLKEMIQGDLETIDPLIRQSFILFPQPLLYLQDNIAENRWYQNEISRLFQANEMKAASELVAFYHTPNREKRPLKIGYIGHTLRRHSIGWLSRWLIHHHDREAFSNYIYMISSTEDNITKHWFRSKVDHFWVGDSDPKKICEQIQKDEIDILVDLDSITFNATCGVMTHKPAPVQVSWLGMDASGIPAIDYYIADPYVLPANAQEYYQETIWRLPQTFLAVDGSEVAVPTLRRENLEIPKEATIYLSVQTGLKRHPDTIRLQMKILKQVPNSYFLIQGAADEEIVKKLFTQIAEAEGVSSDRLRFIPEYPTEIYRANLAIADVVLDTYPFNGGTTTLDILWREIPVVTKVGQQWAARLGYSLLTNAGISEGIAWNDEEYVDWGIRLGKDEQLRQEIYWKLRQGKKTAPLWNAKAFTQEMEKAYQQMWEIYCNS